MPLFCGSASEDWVLFCLLSYKYRLPKPRLPGIQHLQLYSDP